LNVIVIDVIEWRCSLNIFNPEKLVGGHFRKSITSSFFNRITFHLAVSGNKTCKISN